MIHRKNHGLYFLLLATALPLLFVTDIFMGTVEISWSQFVAVFNGTIESDAIRTIVIDSRIPKALTAILCGAALAVSGLLMQTLFRNPLAGPYILGISSGAGLGVAILVMSASFFGLIVSTSIALPIAAMIGAILVLLILFLVSFKVKDVMTLLILGVMIGSIATAIIGLIQYFTTDYQLKSFLLWSLGSLSGIGYQQLLAFSILTTIASLLSFAISKNLNAFLMGEEYATTIGISVKTSRLVMITISGALAGIITAYCGPIGFVGIVVPHLARLLFQTANHQILLPASLLIGAAMLLIGDILANNLVNSVSLPINSITAILGIPIIIWIIFSRRSISSGF